MHPGRGRGRGQAPEQLAHHPPLAGDPVEVYFAAAVGVWTKPTTLPWAWSWPQPVVVCIGSHHHPVAPPRPPLQVVALGLTLLFPSPPTSFLTTRHCWRSMQRTQCPQKGPRPWPPMPAPAPDLAAAARRGTETRLAPCTPPPGRLLVRHPSGDGRVSVGDSIHNHGCHFLHSSLLHPPPTRITHPPTLENQKGLVYVLDHAHCALDL